MKSRTACIRFFNFLTFCLISIALSSAYAQMPVGSNRPAVIPANYVITPSGYFHPSCVRQIDRGETLLADGAILQHADGTLENIDACTFPHYRPDGEIVAADLQNASVPRLAGTYVITAEVTTKTSFGRINATWTVPPAPVSQHGQTIFFFPGLADTSRTKKTGNILQPVLGWNASTGFPNAWSIVSVNCCLLNNDWHGPILPVNPGDTIYGNVQADCAPGSRTCPTWTVTTIDLTSGQVSELLGTPNLGQTFNRAAGGALEVNGITTCTDFPASHSIDFATTVYDDSFKPITKPGWTAQGYYKRFSPQCAYGENTNDTQTKIALFWNLPVYGTGNLIGSSALARVGDLDGNFFYVSCPGVCGNSPWVTLTNQYPFPLWLPDTSTAQWVGPDVGGNENTSDPSGIYQYRETFDLTGFDPTTVSLSGSFATDNSGYIELNGVMVGPMSSSFSTTTPFSITTGFVQGMNTLDFFVTNDVQAIDNPTGLFVELSGVGRGKSPQR